MSDFGMEIPTPVRHPDSGAVRQKDGLPLIATAALTVPFMEGCIFLIGKSVDVFSRPDMRVAFGPFQKAFHGVFDEARHVGLSRATHKVGIQLDVKRDIDKVGWLDGLSHGVFLRTIQDYR